MCMDTCLCALGQFLLPPHRLHPQGEVRWAAKMTEIEMLWARLRPPFISPVNPGTASGEGGSRDSYGQVVQEKDLLPGEHHTAAAAWDKKQPAPAHVLVLFIPQQPQPHWALLSHSLCPLLPLPPFIPHTPGTHILQLVAGALERQSQDVLWNLFPQCFAKTTFRVSGSAPPLVAGSRDLEVWGGSSQGTKEWRNTRTEGSFMPPWCTSL